MRLGIPLWTLALVACGEAALPLGDPPPPIETPGPDGDPGADADEGGWSDEGEDGDGGDPFIPSPDVGQSAPDYPDCAMHEQACGPRRKCVAVDDPNALYDDYGWDYTGCVPSGGAKGFMEPCSFDEHDPNLDDCDIDHWCYEAYPDQPVCVPLRTEKYPECPSGTRYLTTNNLCLSLCVPGCNPLEGCGDQETDCVLMHDVGVCTQAGEVEVGDECAWTTDCVAGTTCMDGDHVAGCEGEYCCTPVCDVNEPGTCEPYGMACSPLQLPPAPGAEHVGVCLG